MKLTCSGRSRYVYNHTLFDGSLNVGTGYPSQTGEVGYRYNGKNDEVMLRFFKNNLHLQGNYEFDMALTSDDVFELIEGMFKNPQQKSIALTLVAALKMLRATDREAELN